MSSQPFLKALPSCCSFFGQLPRPLLGLTIQLWRSKEQQLFECKTQLRAGHSAWQLIIKWKKGQGSDIPSILNSQPSKKILLFILLKIKEVPQHFCSIFWALTPRRNEHGNTLWVSSARLVTSVLGEVKGQNPTTGQPGLGSPSPTRRKDPETGGRGFGRLLSLYLSRKRQPGVPCGNFVLD